MVERGEAVWDANLCLAEWGEDAVAGLIFSGDANGDDPLGVTTD